MKIEAESIESLESLCEERPGSLAFARLASLYLDNGDLDRAVQLCIEGLKRYPNYTSARLVLGRCYEGRGRWEEAATEFRRVCRIDHRNRAALKHLAGALVHLQQPALAGGIYAYLLECDPDDTDLQQLAAATPGQAPQDIHQLLDTVPQGVPPAQSAPAAPRAQAPSPAQAPAQPGEAQTEADLGAPAPSAQAQAPAPAQSGPAAHSAADVKAFADLIENAETIALAPSSSAAPADISGQDISYRIDSLFGADEKSVQGPAEKATAPLRDQDALTALFAAGQSADGSSLDTGRFKMDEIAPDVQPAAPLAGPGQETEAAADEFGATMAFESPLLTEETVEDAAAPAEAEPPLPKPQFKDQPPFAPAVEEHPAGPSGTDVSSRLEEMFDFDAAQEQEPPAAAAQTPAGQPAAPAAPADLAPIEGVSAEHIETAVGDTVTFLDEMSAESDKTAVLSPQEQTALLAGDSVEEPSEETVAVEPAPGSPAEQADDQPTSLLADQAPTTQLPAAAARDAAAVADEVFEPAAGETAGLSLDQEMAFEGADAQQQAVDEVMTAAFEAPPAQIAEELAPATPEETLPDDARPQALESAPVAPEPAPAAAGEDIFSETWLAGEGSAETAPAAPEPQTLEERTEEAQTLAFARDELDDLVAISTDTEQVDKHGDTTTIKSVAELEDETQGLAREAVAQAAAPGAPGDDQTAEMGFQEIRLEAPAAPPKRPDARMVTSDTSLLSQESLAAQTEQYPRVQQPAQQPENPFEAYAQEISQAHTIALRRQDLDQVAGESQTASTEEQAELTDQVSRAQTVEFGRDELRKLRSEIAPAPAPQKPEEPAPSLMDTSVDTSAVFLDEINAGTVEMEPPKGAAEPPAAATVAMGPPPSAAAQDPFLAETLAVESADKAEERGPGDTLVDSRSVVRDEAKRPIMPETVVMDRSEVLPSAELVWEEGPTAQFKAPERAVKGNLADTVAMAGEPPAALDRTERMEPLAEEPSEQEREDQLASIPDHVLTPTLADIYYHQGQPKLAIQIYRRLLQLHPENTRISARIAEIEAGMAAQSQAAAPAGAAPAALSPAPAPRIRRGRRKPKPRPPRPLAGVRIKKAYREQYLRRKRVRRP